MHPIRYLARVAATVLGLALAAIALTVSVDPYRMYGTPVVHGWTALKPRIYQQTAIAKTYQLDRVAPRTLLLGNSRVEIGIDPESRNWPGAAQPVFNAAQAGTGPATALAMLREAIAVRVPDTVLLGVDILDFLEKPTPAMRPPATGVAADGQLVDDDDTPDPRRLRRLWRHRLTTTLTIGAVYDSIATLFDQNPATSVTMTRRGFNPLHEYRIFAERSGYYELFAQKTAQYEAEYLRYPAHDFNHPFRYSSFRYLRRIMNLADKYNINLILYIHPYHALYLEMLHQVGLWPTFEDWKRALVRVVAAENQTAARKVKLYDFAEYDQFTTEPVPPPGDRRSEMRWYWESAHYKSALGDKIIAAIFGHNERFGDLLTPRDVEPRLAAIRAARLRFIAGAHPGMAEAASAQMPDATQHDTPARPH